MAKSLMTCDDTLWSDGTLSTTPSTKLVMTRDTRDWHFTDAQAHLLASFSHPRILVLGSSSNSSSSNNNNNNNSPRPNTSSTNIKNSNTSLLQHINHIDRMVFQVLPRLQV